MLLDFAYEYTNLYNWGSSERIEANNKGYTTTMMGRVRTLEDMASGEYAGYDPLQKVVNTIVQGSAAEILKLGMKAIEHEDIRATVHDEMLVSTDHLLDMRQLSPLNGIKVKWDVATGNNWLACKKTVVSSLPQKSEVKNVFG